MPLLSGVSTEIWGPHAWGFMHAITFRYAKVNACDEERLQLYNFLVSLKQLLPCVRCREHYASYIDHPDHGIRDRNSAHLDNRKTAARWLIGLHNEVNTRLYKKCKSFEEVKGVYEGDYVCPGPPPTPTSYDNETITSLVIVVAITLLLLLGMVFAQRRRHTRQMNALTLLMSQSSELSLSTT